ncbi:unnamed protein product, partial [Sphacelaria rigidula]
RGVAGAVAEIGSGANVPGSPGHVGGMVPSPEAPHEEEKEDRTLRRAEAVVPEGASAYQRPAISGTGGYNSKKKRSSQHNSGNSNGGSSNHNSGNHKKHTILVA